MIYFNHSQPEAGTKHHAQLVRRNLVIALGKINRLTAMIVDLQAEAERLRAENARLAGQVQELGVTPWQP